MMEMIFDHAPFPRLERQVICITFQLDLSYLSCLLPGRSSYPSRMALGVLGDFSPLHEVVYPRVFGPFL